MSLAGADILVVDDNGDNRYTLCRRLRRQGYADLEEASNGREALERLAARPFQNQPAAMRPPGQRPLTGEVRRVVTKSWRPHGRRIRVSRARMC